MFDPFSGRRTARAAAKGMEKDLQFLRSLLLADMESLVRMLDDHSHKDTPRWKRVAIRRAMSRLVPATQEWVHGLDELRRDERHMEPWKLRLLEDARARLRSTVSG